MGYANTSQTIVLDRIVARLIAQLAADGINASTCFQTLAPLESPAIPRGDVMLTVSPGDGVFEEDLQIGGADQQVVEDASVTVTIYTRVKLDAADHAEKVFSEATRGLLVWKQKVLKALAGYELTDASGDENMVKFLIASNSWRPRWDKQSNIGSLGLGFHTDFCWDLS